MLSCFELNLTDADPCVFTSGDAETQLILTIHIDDNLIAAINQSLIDKLLKKMKTNFGITSSEINIYLGLQIE